MRVISTGLSGLSSTCREVVEGKTWPVHSRRLAGSRRLSDGEASHASCDFHLAGPA